MHWVFDNNSHARVGGDANRKMTVSTLTVNTMNMITTIRLYPTRKEPTAGECKCVCFVQLVVSLLPTTPPTTNSYCNMYVCNLKELTVESVL